jgi:NadR type nicotinamide-nucleotide adenylyltransferase
MKKIGFTLGKYAPFHNGHQYVFDTALAECDELLVLIYDTSVITTPLHIRAGWIRALYPQVTVIEGWDGPEGYSTERAFEIMQEEYILQMLAGRRVTHFYSSEFYGDHVSKALGAVDRRLDEARTKVPISATMIREDPFRYRSFLSDLVYRDLITKVVFVGAMSTGKSTLTEALAQRFNTTFAPEYGREYWTKHQVDRRIGLEAFDEIAVGHLEREEEALLQANRYLFVDTNAITTYQYALDYHGKAPALLTQLALFTTLTLTTVSILHRSLYAMGR